MPGEKKGAAGRIRKYLFSMQIRICTYQVHKVLDRESNLNPKIIISKENLLRGQSHEIFEVEVYSPNSLSPIVPLKMPLDDF